MQKMSVRKQRIAKKLETLGMAFDGQKVNGVYKIGIVSFKTLDEIEMYIKECLEKVNEKQSAPKADVVETVKPAENWQDWERALKPQKISKERINIMQKKDIIELCFTENDITYNTGKIIERAVKDIDYMILCDGWQYGAITYQGQHHSVRRRRDANGNGCGNWQVVVDRSLLRA
jgi:hypothetical protein